MMRVFMASSAPGGNMPRHVSEAEDRQFAPEAVLIEGHGLAAVSVEVEVMWSGA